MQRWILLCITVTIATAQRFPDRTLVLNPLAQRTAADTAVQLVSLVTGWGEFGGYLRNGDDEHAWIQRLGALAELVRWDSTASLGFVSEIEFIANPHNDIRFNPRAVFWQEGFLFTRRAGQWHWQLGYYHRCKHDVDNLTVGQERSLIYGSLLGKVLVPLQLADAATAGLLAARADVYTIRQDYRLIRQDNSFSEDGNTLPRVSELLATLGASLHLRHKLSPLFALDATAWLHTNFYSQHSGLQSWTHVYKTLLNAGATVSLALTGAARFRIGLTYEYLSDTGIRTSVDASHFVYLTVSVLNPHIVW